MRPSGRRQAKESLIPQPPTPMDFNPRQSDASSRPSSSSLLLRPSLDQYKDRSFQQSVVSSLNSFLSSHNFPISFKSTFPSAKDILNTLNFLLSLLDFPYDHLPLLLKRLNYPFSINKSILRSPAAPHQWPSLLALLHWLLQISKFNLHLSSSNSLSSLLTTNLIHQYTLDSYIHYIRGDDDAVDALDLQISSKLDHQKSIAEEKLKSARDEAQRLECELERLKSEPSEKEKLEREKGLLVDDVAKFRRLIEELGPQIEQRERLLAEKEKQLEAKVEESKRIREENEELKRRVEAQTFNARDVERMKRELQAVERDIGEAELARNAWEDKSWEIDTTLAHNFKDIEALALDCNQDLRRFFSFFTPCVYCR